MYDRTRQIEYGRDPKLDGESDSMKQVLGILRLSDVPCTLNDVSSSMMSDSIDKGRYGWDERIFRRMKQDIKRLQRLESMGLAIRTNDGRWYPVE